MESHKEPTITIYCCMYACCGSEYTTKFNLKRHIESVHLHVKKFKCTLCNSLFASKQSLKEHFHIHSGAMPFKCVLCAQKFRQASQLSLHKRSHLLKGEIIPVIKKQRRNKKCFDIKPIDFKFEINFEEFKLPPIREIKEEITALPFLNFQD